MFKEVLIGVGSALVIAAIIAAIKYRMSHGDEGTIETAYEDELNMGEIKKWFADKMTNDNHKGAIFYPTKENTEKWKVKMPEQGNMIIQLVYDYEKDEVVAYREISFAEMSPKLKDLLEANGGTVVIEK